MKHQFWQLTQLNQKFEIEVDVNCEAEQLQQKPASQFQQ
jgi:hypothetical protein